MSINMLRKNRKKRKRRWPKPRLDDGVRGMLPPMLVFAEGWLCSYAVTHSRLPEPLGTGTPQWLITGSLLMAIILPFLLLLTVWGSDDDDR